MYKIADFVIDVGETYPFFKRTCKEYLSLQQEPNLTFQCTIEDRENERTEERNIPNAYLEFTAIYRKIAEWLPYQNAFVLHSACFDVEGTGVAFAAHSGTGKTTHMNLWQEYLGDKMVIVNGDKPIVRFFDDKPNVPYVYGTPWNGKEDFGCNMRTKLQHICFIERSETNYVEKVEKSEIIDRIFNQVYMPKDMITITKTMELIDRLISNCDLWIIHCNMDKDAAEVAYKRIFVEK